MKESKKEVGLGILEGIAKITVINTETGKEIAVITHDEVATAGEKIVVKLTPCFSVNNSEKALIDAMKELKTKY